MQLPQGVERVTHRLIEDHRGDLREMFRLSWGAIAPVQWNIVRSQPRVLRGVHIHVVHADYLVAIDGEMLVKFVDCRPESPTHGLRSEVLLSGEVSEGLVIPPGVAHGFYFAGRTTFTYAVTDYWSLDDELGCRWDDPDLGLSWDEPNPLLSTRDAAAGGFAEMTDLFLKHRAALAA